MDLEKLLPEEIPKDIIKKIEGYLLEDEVINSWDKIKKIKNKLKKMKVEHEKLFEHFLENAKPRKEFSRTNVIEDISLFLNSSDIEWHWEDAMTLEPRFVSGKTYNIWDKLYLYLKRRYPHPEFSLKVRFKDYDYSGLHFVDL